MKVASKGVVVISNRDVDGQRMPLSRETVCSEMVTDPFASLEVNRPKPCPERPVPT